MKTKQPVQVLWGSKGTVGQLYDVLKLWRKRAENVIGQAFTCGHFLPEEAPEETYQALIQFLDK
ncbi:alpha/beta fold hydrolase [Halalkalibacter nanhaiisediminis]|uniref:Haloacetate dehalogenase n=1 Tax=Halalkalibacter nanhaiisediminis TaxID=688079 RepID=A0A562QQN8_9BACI|nr:alpha/beta hydrolase [Halalkalibacter nanhaiisediminis]TWI59071.1 haloacetate dehalogenase [Halalkalibacter nanhaiisediminis]